MQPIIREVQASDYSGIHKLMFNELGLSVSLQTIISQVAKMQPDDNYLIIMALINNKLVGFAAICKSMILEMANPYFRLIGLSVATNYLRKKIGTKLLDYIINYAGDHSIAYIAINSLPNLTEDHAFFKSLGFEKKSVCFSLPICM